MNDRTKDLQCIHRAGCTKPKVCGEVGHCTSMTAEECLNMAKLENDSECSVMPPVSGKTLLELAVEERNRPSKPKLEDFPHPQGGYSTMSFHNALIYWQEREIERLQRDNDRLNDYIKGLPDNESCAHPAMKGTQAYKCELCGQLEERNADETTDVRIKNLTRALHAKQAKIDALMLEFCPGEMQAEQKSEWAEHQQRSLEEPRETSRDDARDAARYRYIRQGEDMLSPEDEDHYNKMWQTILPKGCDRKRMDTAIDAAIAKSSAVEPSEQPPVETGLRTGELAQLRTIDAAARFYVDSVKPGTGLAWENLMNALFDGRPEKAK